MTPREAAGPGLDAVLLRVGKLNYTWTNTESLLIHMIAGLTGVGKDVAVVIFLTLNTTRARVDLVNRLAKMPGRDRTLRDRVLDCTGSLLKESALRNRYNHCIYSFDPDGQQIQTIMMRIQDRKHDIKMGKTQQVDADEMEQIDQSIARLDALNRQIWGMVAEYGFPV